MLYCPSHQGSPTLVNIYELNIRAPKYTRKMLTGIRGEIGSNTIIVGNFNTPLKPMDRSSKQRINTNLK